MVARQFRLVSTVVGRAPLASPARLIACSLTLTVYFLLAAVLARPPSSRRRPGARLGAAASCLWMPPRRCSSEEGKCRVSATLKRTTRRSSRVEVRAPGGTRTLASHLVLMTIDKVNRVPRQPASALSQRAALKKRDLLLRRAAEMRNYASDLMDLTMTEAAARGDAYGESSLQAAARRCRGLPPVPTRGPVAICAMCSRTSQVIRCMMGPAQAHRDQPLAVFTVLPLPIAMGRCSPLAKPSVARGGQSAIVDGGVHLRREGRR